MVGVSRQDGLGTVDLLDQHRADQQMRPRRLAKGQNEIRLRPQGRIEAERPADQEGDGTAPIIPPSAQRLGAILAGQIAAPFVHRDQNRAIGDLRP